MVGIERVEKISWLWAEEGKQKQAEVSMKQKSDLLDSHNISELIKIVAGDTTIESNLEFLSIVFKKMP